MEKMFDWKKRYYQVHKPNRVDPKALKTLAGTKVTDCWKVVPQIGAGIVLNNAAWDLTDYFAVSMNTTVALGEAGESAPNTIWVGVDASLGEQNFRVEILADRIVITGNDERYAAQGCYYLEDMMNMAQAPIVEPGITDKHCRYSMRENHGGMEFNEYPDELLRHMAHNGLTTIHLQAKRAVEEPEYREYLNDVMQRAQNWGLDTSTYVPHIFKNTMHPDEPGAFEFYENMYGKLVEYCPLIKQLRVVGECCEFPSKDERTTGKSWRLSAPDEEKLSPGWFPCNDYYKFISLLRDVIKKHNPNVELVFWSYNWGWADEDLRLDMIRNVPTDITMMATFEMFHKEEVAPGITEESTDYTIWNIGPGNYFASESKLHKEMGRKMYSMAHTGGATWDIGIVPYLPVPQRWIQRWNAVNAAQDNWRLDGVVDAHTYGYWPGFVSEMTKQAFMTPMPDMDELLRKIIARDFGEENVDAVYKAYELFSEGITHCMPTCVDQYGPARVGPVYPLIYKTPVEMPHAPEEQGNPNFESNPIYKFSLDFWDRLRFETKEYATLASYYDAGCEILEKVIETLPENKKENAKDILGVGRMVAATARTVSHVKRFHDLKAQLGIYLDTIAIWAGGRKNQPEALPMKTVLVPTEEPVPVLLEMIEIAKKEIANTESIIPYIQRDSRLGYEQEFGYACTEEQLRWKIAHTNSVIDNELLPALQEAFSYKK